MSFDWPLTVYYGMSIICLPFYVLVTICLVKLRAFSKIYSSTFYTIFLQHCFADILSMIIFLFIWGFRKVTGIREFYFKYQNYYIAAATYNTIYYLLYIRCWGILCLSIHRYLIIGASSSKFTEFIKNAEKWKILTIYWTIPTILSLGVLKETNFSYNNIDKMEIVAPRHVIQQNTLMALIVVSSTCTICLISYASLYYFLTKNTAAVLGTLKREIHLAVQVFALLFAFFLMFLYYFFTNYFAQTQNEGPIYTMRSIYPIANGILSYINPFCILCLNRDFSSHFLKMMRCESLQVSVVLRSSNIRTRPVAITS